MKICVCEKVDPSFVYSSETLGTANIVIKSKVNKLWSIHIPISNLYANQSRAVM